MENQKQYDICLISSALIESVPTPPAGVPSLVAYLKAQGYFPLVLDLDLFFKKIIPAYRFFLFLECQLIFARQSRFNVPISNKNAKKIQKVNDFKSIGRRGLKKIGKALLGQVRKWKNSSFKIR